MGGKTGEVIYKGLSALTTQFSPPSGRQGSSWRWNFWYELEIGDTYDSHHSMCTIKVGEFWDHRMALYSNSPSSENISNIPNLAGLLSATLPSCQNFPIIANISNIPNWSGLPPPAVSKPAQLPLLPDLLSPRRSCWPSCWCCCCCCCCCWWGRWCWTSLLFTSRDEGGVQKYYFHIVLGPKPIWHFLVGRYQNEN